MPDMGDEIITDSQTIEMRTPYKALPRLQRQHFLDHQKGEGAPRRVSLGAHPTVLGRADHADIVIQSAQASRRHAIIHPRHGEYQLLDNNSRNGIYLNEIKVHSAILRDGDMIQIAEDVFIYREG